ncbi:hypothetical protein ACEWY4_019627 [Coilia grayii]|uniref:Protein NO VEIN C-terminal domain-containing protein n=1 Tax=Coilia grayii TaxID=363190 RepID=A0ABD1JA90_9TELE
MATQRHVVTRTSRREEVTQGGTKAKAPSKEEERKRGGGHQGGSRGVKIDGLVAKGPGETKKGMALPRRARGQGTTKDAQQLQAKVGGRETNGNDHLQLTLQVRVEGALHPHQHLGGDKAAESTGRYKKTGKVGREGRGSSAAVALNKSRSLDTKAGDSKTEEVTVGNRNGCGHAVPGFATATHKAKGKEATVVNTEGKPANAPGRAGDDLGLEEANVGNRNGRGHAVAGVTTATHKAKGKEATVVNTEGNPANVPGRLGDDLSQDVKDYLYLLKLLRIHLPDGVLNADIIKVSKTQTCIADAHSITTELENFRLQFSMTPRLGCREVKRALALKTNEDVLELTNIIFFEISKKEDRGTLMENWKKNSSNTGKGFRLRERYRKIPISTPAVYSTAITRSLSSSEQKDNKAKVTDGVRVNVTDLENMEYSDESLLDKSGTDRFGRYHQNKTDEVECLKFFHELGEINSSQAGVRYTKGNKVECGFLSGRLDFLAQIQKVSGKKSTADERLVIECKGTTGDMVGKLFTKSGEHCALLVKSHEYSYQTQAYMYILNQEARLLKRSVSNRAVMVIRHYYGDGANQRDFHWSYLQLDDKIQRDISDLMLYCQREVLARFLAVLDLIFQKEMT